MAFVTRTTEYSNTPPTNELYKVYPINDHTRMDIDRSIGTLRGNIQMSNETLQNLIGTFNSYLFEQSDDLNEYDCLRDEDPEQKYERLHLIYDSMLKFRLELSKEMMKHIRELESLQPRILDVELKRWKKEEQLYGNMSVKIGDRMFEYPFNQNILKDNLEIIKNWCKDLISIIFLFKKQLKIMKSSIKEIEIVLEYEKEIIPLSHFDSPIEHWLGNLIKSTFIITRQPIQIMDFNNFSATSYVNLLVAHDLGFVDEKSFPNIEVSLISGPYVIELLDQEDYSLKSNPFDLIFGASEARAYFMGDKIKCIYNQENKLNCYSNHINAKISITGFENHDRIFPEDKPSYLLFETKFNVINSEYGEIKVLALSVPVVMNFLPFEGRAPDAEGKLIWCNAFGKPSSVLPNTVPWLQVVREIERTFYLETYQTPTKENLQFMAKKAFRKIDSDCQDFSTNLLSWAQFYKKLLPGKKFTFWEWLFEIMELSKKCPIDKNKKKYQKYPMIAGLPPRTLWKNKKFDKNTLKEIEEDFKFLFPDHS